MQQLTNFLDQHFAMLFTVAMVWAFGAATWRSMRGRKLRSAFREREAMSPLFQESWVSGRSLRDWQTRLGVARNCLRVTVNEREVLIRPLFPLDVFTTERFDLEHHILRSALVAVEEHRAEPRHSLLLRFKHNDGGERSFEVFLRDPDAFMRVLANPQPSRNDRELPQRTESG